MKYPRLYTSLAEFEKMELRHGSAGWSIDEFFDELDTSSEEDIFGDGARSDGEDDEDN